jgi:hypothetical protein
MVHRDLKPHNLMLTPGGRVKILDFGLARFADEAARGDATGSGTVLGTVDYIAPEQADNAHGADIRSDLYSLGCTLYHLLAGRPPFPTGTPLQKLTAHVSKKPQPLTELRDDLPEGLMSVLERMTAKNPRDRYQTPAEVAIALEPFAVPTAVARVPRRRRRAPATDRGRTVVLDQTPARFRGRRLFAIATAILFLLAGLLGAAVYRIATDKGELVITSESDDVKVVITQGGKLVDVIDTKTDKQISLALRSGEYELELKGAPEGLTLDIESAKLTRGKTVLATISRDKPVGGITEPPPAKKPQDGVVAWWRADGNAKDSVGEHHGTLKGGVKFSPGVAAQAFDFNGIDGQVDLGNGRSLHLSSGDFSVSAWVKFRSLKRPPSNADKAPPGDMGIVLKMSSAAGSNTDGWGLIKQDDNHFWFGFGGGNTNGFGGDAAPTMIRSTNSVVAGVWYHVVAVKTAAHFSLYVNGIEEASKPLPTFKDTNAAELLLGAAAGDAHMAGLIDEVTVYNRALSNDEVKACWKALTPVNKQSPEKDGQVTLNESASKYLTLPIDKVASAVSTKPLFTPVDWERLVLPTWGKQEVFGIPFHVIDPKGDSVKNAIVLYAPGGERAREMPTFVRLKCGSPAKAIHLLSGVSGWGGGPDKTVCVIVRLHYRDGGQEDHELINGIHFANYHGDDNERYPEIPGSRIAIRLLETGKFPFIRYLAIQPKTPTKNIEEIEFIKGMKDVTAPVIMAVTVERPSPPAEKAGEVRKPTEKDNP